MKWLKWLLILAVGAGVALGTVGCEDDDDDGGGNPLVGTWKATAFNGQQLDDSISVVVTFRKDGTVTTTYTIGGESDSETGTWSAANGVLTVTADGETDSANYSIAGSTLTISDEDGTFTLKKQ